MMRFIFALIVGVVLLPTVAYAVGRILLPEMGLTAPPYSAWFWAFVVGVALYLAIQIVAAWIMGD